MAKIKVTRFKIWNPEKDIYIISKLMAPDEEIARAKGVPIENTSIEIDTADLNENYMYLPPADKTP